MKGKTIALSLFIVLSAILLYGGWAFIIKYEDKQAADAERTLEDNYYNQDRVEINLDKIEIDNCTDIIKSDNELSKECNAQLYDDSNEANSPLVPVQIIDDEILYEGFHLSIGDSIEYRPAYQGSMFNALTITRVNYPAVIEVINGEEIE